MTTTPKIRKYPRGATAAWSATILLTAFAADQSTKWWALTALDDGVSIPVLPSVSLRLAFNPGAAFGLGGDAGPVTAVGVLAILIALTGWIMWKIRNRDPLLGILLLAVVAGGAWGNMYDRITRATDGFLSGHVVDFIAVDWFAIFNIGDVLTVCGIIAWAASMVFITDTSRTAEAHRPSP